MNDFSFGIKTTSDLFNKLIEDFEEFRKDTTSSRMALNCAMTAWHLTDWSYYEFNQTLSSDYSTLVSYQQAIKERCPSLQILHDITNGSKHYVLLRHKPIVKETNLHIGAYSAAYSHDYDISTLEIEMGDGTKKYFDDEIQKAIEFWTQYLQSNFNIILSGQK